MHFVQFSMHCIGMYSAHGTNRTMHNANTLECMLYMAHCTILMQAQGADCLEDLIFIGCLSKCMSLTYNLMKVTMLIKMILSRFDVKVCLHLSPIASITFVTELDEMR